MLDKQDFPENLDGKLKKTEFFRSIENSSGMMGERNFEVSFIKREITSAVEVFNTAARK